MTPTLFQSMAALTIAVACLVLHPDVQRRAQAEIDAMVGRERLPTFDDRAHSGDILYDPYAADGKFHSHDRDNNTDVSGRLTRRKTCIHRGRMQRDVAMASYHTYRSAARSAEG